MADCQAMQCFEIKQKIESDIVHFEMSRECNNVVLYLCSGYVVRDNKIDAIVPLCYGSVQNQLYTIITRSTEKAIFVCDNIEMYNFLSKCKYELEINELD